MIKKNFSLFLALRYLNPVRTSVSVITIISLLGVSTGVMVLVVSLSVMNGFENMLKDIVLTSRPHIYLEHRSVYYEDTDPIAEPDWRSKITELEKKDYILSASPRVSDYVLVELSNKPSPIEMIGVDTSNPIELEKFSKVVSEGDASRLQEGDCCIISSHLRDSSALQIGQKILVYSTSNTKQLLPAYKRIDMELFAKRESDSITNAIEFLSDNTQWESDALFEKIPLELVRPLVNNFLLNRIEYDETLRAAEKEILQGIFDLLADPTAKNVELQTMEYEAGTRQQALALFQSLSNLNIATIDNEELRGFKELILPKELEIVGISQANNFAKGTDLFVPFSIAQDLVNIEDSIQGLSLTLEKPYEAALYKEVLIEDASLNIAKTYPEFADYNKKWTAHTWMESSSELFKVMDMQKFMMVFVLSFIVLIAIFSIAAVMFTVAIQKKREIGVMKALGATPRQIMNVFAYQGIFVGIVGSISGLFLGWLILQNIGSIQAFIRIYLKFNPFPRSIYGTDEMPTQIETVEFIVIGIGAMVLCTIASLLPAWAASRTDAAKSLRNL